MDSLNLCVNGSSPSIGDSPSIITQLPYINIYIYLLYLFLLRQKGPAYMETDVGLQIKLGICLLEKHK